MVDVPGTFGALFIGGIVAVLFSGVVSSQAFSYFKNYPDDHVGVRILAGAVWFLDLFHTVWITVSLWDHLIAHFGDVARVDYIPWSLALTIAFTAILTFLVHLFFVHRIYRLSHNNILIAFPLALLATARLCFACLTTAKLIQLRSLQRFVQLYTWSFTIGLTLSSFLDILITSLLCWLLLSKHKMNSSMNHVLDRLMLYTFEYGSLTCAATLASLIFWLADKPRLIFLGLHFVISKFYANSLLATLNTRKNLQPRSHRSNGSVSAERNHAVMFPDFQSRSRHGHSGSESRSIAPVQIKVDQTKMSVSDDIIMAGIADEDSINLKERNKELV